MSEMTVETIPANMPVNGRRDNCGGCLDLGSHRRWCPEVVGSKAARLGGLAEEAESLGDRIGASDPSAAGLCYQAAAYLTVSAYEART